MSRRAASIAAVVSLALLPAIAAAQPAPGSVAPVVPPGLTPVYPPGIGPTPPQLPPPPPLDLTGMDLMLPPTLTFEEGQTVPLGYVLKAHRDRALLVSGSLAFGVSYLSSVIASFVAIGQNPSSASYTPLFVPVIGPYITLGTAGASGAAALWLAVDGLAQTGGATLFVYSLVTQEKYLAHKGRATASTLDVLLHPALMMGPRLGVARWVF